MGTNRERAAPQETSLLTILIVEDNPDHLFLARRAIQQEFGDGVRILAAESGELAVQMLQQQGAYAESPRPDLVLLDVQLPGRDGFWVTRMIKNDPALAVIPIVIFTSSDAEADVREGYEAGGNVYVCKPTGPDEFAERLRAIPVFWSRIALLPPRDSAPQLPDARKKPPPNERRRSGAR